MNQAQYGGSVGGPVVADRTFYFANVEQRRLDQTGLTTISDANVAAINARLAAVGYQGPPVATGVYPNPVDTTNFLGKIDHQVSGRDQFSVRYSLYDVDAENSRGAGGLNAPSASSDARQPRPDDRAQQHADAVAANGARNARAVRPQRPAGAADRSDRTGGEHRRRRVVRNELRQPDTAA